MSVIPVNKKWDFSFVPHFEMTAMNNSNEE